MERENWPVLYLPDGQTRVTSVHDDAVPMLTEIATAVAARVSEGEERLITPSEFIAIAQEEVPEAAEMDGAALITLIQIAGLSAEMGQIIDAALELEPMLG